MGFLGAGKPWDFLTQALMCRLAASYWPSGDSDARVPLWAFSWSAGQ